DYVINALVVLPKKGLMPPEHLLRRAFETCANFAAAVELLRQTPVSRPVIFTVAGAKPGERVVIEREEHEARVLSADSSVANAWRGMPPGWRPRVCGAGAPEENNRSRMAALESCRDGEQDWCCPPVVNATTRLTVDLCPANGRLAVQGWEANPDGGAHPVTNRLALG
ncbi:MAG TPA: hypothetical protein VEC14_06845, partial [Reyranellaceae bacterium]|nr:hypothetical protein [Reyranellaceae bacterium]